MKKKSLVALLLASLMMLSACGGGAEPAPAPSQDPAPAPVEDLATAGKYVFLFIADGTALPQIKAAETYLKATAGAKGDNAMQQLCFTAFPNVATTDTYCLDSAVTDSSAAATAIATGHKTNFGYVNINPADESSWPSMATLARDAGKQVAIVTDVYLNDATPAAFYGSDYRGDYFSLAKQMADSNFNFFATGGPIYCAVDNEWINYGEVTIEDVEQDAFYRAVQNGYTLVNNRADFDALTSGDDKIIATVAYDNVPVDYWENIGNVAAIDRHGDYADALSLKDFVRQGIEVMSDAEEGFFMMAEGGKIDWLCHENDAASVVKQVIDFADAVQVAVDFYNEHPDETVIVVTGDHETGGLTLGAYETDYDLYPEILDQQTMSGEWLCTQFYNYLYSVETPSFEDFKPVITEGFGLLFDGPEDDVMTLTDYEKADLEEAFWFTVDPSLADTSRKDYYKMYGKGDAIPISIMCARMINERAGFGFTSWKHTNLPTMVYAIGEGSEVFGGNLNNTDIFWYLCDIMGLDAK